MWLKLHEFFVSKRNLFQLAFQYKNYLWTHAGIHRGWYKNKVASQKCVVRHNEKIEGLTIDHNEQIADILNFLFEARHDAIFDCGLIRGGYQKNGGPLWADKNETYKKPLDNYHQIIGHTHIDEVKHYKNYKGDTSTTYVDCMNIKNSYDKNFYILEIN
jgi:hypothetical protein